MAQNTDPSDLDELLGAEIEPATVHAARDALEAHEGLTVLVEVKAPDATTVLHTYGNVRKARSALTDFDVGGEQLPSGHCFAPKARLTLPEDSTVTRFEGGFRLTMRDPDGCVLAIALLPSEEAAAGDAGPSSAAGA